MRHVSSTLAKSLPLREHSVVRSGALIISTDPAALGLVRSLGRRGIPVWVLLGGYATPRFSRYAQRTLPWPEGEAKQLQYLLDLGAQHGLDGWTIFPTGDEPAALLARHQATLARRFRLTTPAWEVMRWGYDKRLTYDLAADLGIDHPWTCCPRSREEITALDCPFPIILKPAIKEQQNRFTRARAWRVDDRQTLLARYDEACSLADPSVIMLQEMVPGGGDAQFSFAALCLDGRPLVQLVARRTRQFPIDFGQGSTHVETVDQPEVAEPSYRLLAAIRYTGLVEIEFKCDTATGSYKLLDMNTRTWAWHTLGRRAGLDFPYLLWQVAHGEPVPEVHARCGVRWVFMAKDLPAAVLEMRRRRLSFSEYLHSLRPPLEFAIFAPDDPLPALLDVPLLLSRSLKARRQQG